MITSKPFAAFVLVAALVGLVGSAGAKAEAAPHPVGTIVTIGDSIMSGHGLVDDEAWPAILAGEDGLDLVNLACSGAGFIATGSCGDDYAGLLAAVIQAQPDIVVIQSSSNDIGNSAQAIRTATEQTVAAIHAAVPHARIIGLSTIWNDKSDLPAEIAQSSLALEVAVHDAHGRFIDVGQPLEGHPEWMQSDDVHPTLAGQEALVTAMRSGLLAAGFAV